MILVITLIVVGPERLPSVAKTLGRFIGKAKRSFENIKQEVASEFEIDELNKQLKDSTILKESKEIAEELKNMAKVQDGENSIVKETMNIAEEMKDIVRKSGGKTPKDMDRKE
ncbi:MAG: twin-arginine translocase TatA/TatE family subunit [Alcanivoracaceae bacterium]|nr:twin-arginine translocase TatA/TatE family subunit [Alcanivoracaceae bacterium]